MSSRNKFGSGFIFGTAIVSILSLSACATTERGCRKEDSWQGACLTPAREIKGWPGWTCRDFRDRSNQSVWQQNGQGPESWRAYQGRCDSWARNTASFDLKDSELLPFRRVSAWPGWVCADFKDKRPASVWSLDPEGRSERSVYEGTCESWEKSKTFTQPESP